MAQTELHDRALVMFESIERYTWRPAEGLYFAGNLNLDGTPVLDNRAPQFDPAFGRVAVYFAKKERQKDRYLEMAKRMAAITKRDPLPEQFSAQDLANRVHLLLDIYDLSKDERHLDEAIKYADLGIERLWRKGLFARRVGDPYYESKDGIGSYVAGLLRLHLRLHKNLAEPAFADWSI